MDLKYKTGARKEALTSKHLTLKDSTKIWYEFKPGKKGFAPIVFIHGNAQNHTTAQETLKHLNALGHPIILYDLPGHGKSEAYKNNFYSMERFSETLDVALKITSAAKPILMGHSMGGMVALHYAAASQKNVRGLILIDTVDFDPVKANKKIPVDKIVESIVKKSYETFKEALQGETYRYDKNPQLSEDDILMIGLQYTIPKALDGNFKATTTFDVRSKLSQTKLPALIIRGESDLLMTAEMTKEMQERIPGSKVVTVSNYGHNFLIQRPDLLWNIIKDNYHFLNFLKGK